MSGPHLKRQRPTPAGFWTAQHDGYLGEPWLGDEMSREVQDFYNRHVMDSAHGPYAALVAYHAELVSVRDTLLQTEQEYRRTEGENSALWGRL